MKKRGGFTLLELLMVVIIIAILASIALPQYFRAAERSRASEALQIMATMRGSELRYKALDPGNQYTVALGLLDVDVPGFGTAPASKLWTYVVTGAGAGSNAQSTRIAGAAAGKTISLDLDSGQSCTSDANTYGLTAGAC